MKITDENGNVIYQDEMDKFLEDKNIKTYSEQKKEKQTKTIITTSIIATIDIIIIIVIVAAIKKHNKKQKQLQEEMYKYYKSLNEQSTQESNPGSSDNTMENGK